jgi:hypothetical protein
VPLPAARLPRLSFDVHPPTSVMSRADSSRPRLPRSVSCVYLSRIIRRINTSGKIYEANLWMSAPISHGIALRARRIGTNTRRHRQQHNGTTGVSIRIRVNAMRTPFHSAASHSSIRTGTPRNKAADLRGSFSFSQNNRRLHDANCSGRAIVRSARIAAAIAGRSSDACR